MFHLDYLSCLLTVLSTVLVARKLWAGLAVAAVNSVIVCFIGFHTSQFGFIPANLFCIAVYACSLRTWRRQQKTAAESGPAIPAELPPAVQPVPRCVEIRVKKSRARRPAESCQVFQTERVCGQLRAVR